MSEFKIKDYDSSLQLHNEEEFPFLSLPCSPAPENCFKVFDSPLYEVAPKQAKRKTSPTAKEYPLEFKTRPQILFPFDEPQTKSLLQEDKMESKQEDDEHVNHNEIQLAAEKGHEEAQQQEVEQHESTRNNKAGDSYTNEEAWTVHPSSPSDQELFSAYLWVEKIVNETTLTTRVNDCMKNTKNSAEAVEDW